ncbi:DoxX family protein [Herbidospora mongoliensis]|uniref:DoxX family protein n=1 Tax=Herbidospora mongoliensis TaxID=688067 RepID=UPI000836CC5D|nr:DoxX family protein [Herbidospora mongoliensis]
MFVAYAVIAVLLALGLLPSAWAKLTRQKRVVQTFTEQLGVPLGLYPFLAACEIAAAAGLVIGLWYGLLGIAAAVGLVLYFIGAIGTHLRKSDVKGIVNPGVILVLAVAALLLRAASM